MTRHDDMVRLRHMLDHAREAVSLIEGKNREDLDRERLLELSITRLIEIVGEAAERVNQECQRKFNSIPWPEVIGMRNRLIHGYEQVDLDVLWDTIEDDLPPLIAKLETALREIDPEKKS